MAKDTGKKLADMMYGRQPFDVPTPENLRLGRELIDQELREKASRDAKLTPRDRALAVYEAAKMLGTAAVAGIGSIPTRIVKGPEAADKYMQDRIFIPTTEKGLEHVEDIGSFLERLETQYKIPPIMPEVMALQNLTGPATKQATRAAKSKAMQAGKAGERYAERKVPEVMERGGLGADILSGMSQGSQSRIFVGPKSKTWHQGRAEMAEAMEEAGRSPQEIWLATGTFRGRDGILRQEIDDRMAKFLMPDDRKEIVESLKGQMGELKEQVRPSKQKDLFPKALTEAKKEVKGKIGELKEEIKAREKNPRTQGLEAKYIFEHPELYKAYPELADLNVVVDGRGSSPGTHGALSIIEKSGERPGAMEMDIYNRGLLGNPTSTTLHEMQHAVQTLEGMGPGGSPTMAFAHPETKEIYQRRMNELYQPGTFEEFQRANRFPEDKAQAAYDEYVKTYKPFISPAIERQVQQEAAMEYYRRLLGEAEARAVQDRQLMTPGQRMETPPPASYDVPQEDLIVKPPREFAEGGRVHISDNPDTMALELAGGGLAKIGKMAKAAKAAKEAAVPLDIPRVRPTKQDILEAAERVGRQQLGEHVTNPLTGKTTNLAGRSMKESKRVKNLEYDIKPIKQIPESKPYEAKIGEVNIALPGDQTVADMILHSVEDVPIGSVQEGGAKFGLGRMLDPEQERAFWASNLGPASNFQNKVNEIAQKFDTDQVTAYHLAMGQMANNFAQHFADANMRAIDYSKLNKNQMEIFDSIIAYGYKDPATGEMIKFPEWPGIANPEASLEMMKQNPNLRKWFNNRMKTPDVTAPLNLPNGKSIEWAITEPEIRNMEVNLTGLSAGRMKPGAELIPESAHQTYSHDIPGTALGHAPELAPFSISFPDVTSFVREKYRPQDFTGTIQKVFPHQVVDEAYLEDMYNYYTQLRKVRGFNDGGAVKKADGGEITADDLILEERKL